MDVSKVESIDRAAEAQNAVLDQQWGWLNNFPVTDELRQDIFKHLCSATGMLLDAMLDPEKFDKLVTPD